MRYVFLSDQPPTELGEVNLPVRIKRLFCKQLAQRIRDFLHRERIHTNAYAIWEKSVDPFTFRIKHR